MRLVVTGRNGQVVRALLERAGPKWEVVTLARPGFDLSNLAGIAPAIEVCQPDLIVSAAAFTAVDKAESEADLARTINADAPYRIGEAANKLHVPVIHLSTDYVFSGDEDRAYTEGDATGPTTIYGQTKLAGEASLAAATADHVIVRTAWVYSPFGTNFVKTMLRLAGDRDEIGVVSDQRGNPTSALDVADGILAIAANLLADRARSELRGIFHMVNSGEASWAEFASAVFSQSRSLGGPCARVTPIASADYLTAARRPANSCLSTAKVAKLHGIRLPDWPVSLRVALERLVPRQG